MPSDPKAKQPSPDKSKESRKPSSSSSTSKSSSSSRSSSSSKTPEQIREEEWGQLVRDLVNSHAGWLSPPIFTLSETFSLPPLHTTIILLILFLLAHLYVPIFLLPHLSAMITLLIPFQNTLAAIRLESSTSSSGSKGDAPQWLAFWLVFIILEWLRGWMKLYRPGSNGVFELGRSAALVIMGGGWFARRILRPDGPSKVLQEAGKREAAKAKQRATEQTQGTRTTKTGGEVKTTDSKDNKATAK